MTPQQSIQPLNIAAATLLFQLLFIAIVAIATSLSEPRKSYAAERDERISKMPILITALIGFATLLISEDFYSIWRPIFGSGSINTISANLSIVATFVCDTLLVIYLIACTGGSRSSPFVGMLFMLPALAIFLRLPPVQFIALAVLSSIAYLALLTQQTGSDNDSPPFGRLFRKPGISAVAFINIACLCLSIFTGYITRPTAITELSSAAPEPTLNAP